MELFLVLLLQYVQDLSVSIKEEIIHSEKWINSRVAVNDKFWVDLSNGGNEKRLFDMEIEV